MRSHIPFAKQPVRSYFLYSKGNYDKIRAEAKSFARTSFFDGREANRTVEENWMLIKRFLQQSIEKNIPSKNSRKVKSLPWVTGRIRSKIKRRNKVHQRYKSTGCDALKLRWEELRNGVKSDLKDSHQEYINDMMSDVIKHYPKPFWKYINRQRSDQQCIPTLKSPELGDVVSDVGKAELLNEQFSSVYNTTEHDSIPYHRPMPVLNEMTSIKVTAVGVRKLLEGINPNKSMGPDGVHPRVLRELASELSGMLCYLFQQSLDTGCVPSGGLQMPMPANVCPLSLRRRTNLCHKTIAQSL
jgi:hypothetical protein